MSQCPIAGDATDNNICKTHLKLQKSVIFKIRDIRDVLFHHYSASSIPLRTDLFFGFRCATTSS